MMKTNHKLEWAEREALKFIARYCPSCGFKFNNSYRNAGLYDTDLDVIYLSRHFVNHNNEALITDIILHEIAHALTPGHGHDTVWKAKCREIGATPVRRCRAKMPLRWRSTCCSLEYGTNKLTKRYKYGCCVNCRKTLTWVKN